MFKFYRYFFQNNFYAIVYAIFYAIKILKIINFNYENQ